HAEKLRQGFIHRQSMANAMRFSTVELGELESKIVSAADRAVALELKFFEDLVGETMARGTEIARAATALARLDVAAALAELAVTERYCRPQVDDSLAFAVAGGRHPVVEAALRAGHGAAFVGNDCDLAAGQRLWLLTGPNMAGKSTFLRQNALIAILAQAGSYEPGERTGAGDPGRDRARHRHLRRALDRLGHGRAPARHQPLPRALRDPLP